MNGFFYGGVAQGIEAGRAEALARDKHQTDTAFRERALALQENAQTIGQANSIDARLDAEVGKTMATIENLATAGRTAGHSPQRIAKSVKPLLDDVMSTLASAGRDPSSFARRAEAMIGMPAAPSTSIGKLKADLNAGLISQEEYDAAVAKATAPSGQTINVGTAGESQFAKTLGDELAKDLVKSQGTARDAVRSLESTEQARTLLDSGVITGTGADWLLEAGKALQRIGINIKPDAIANTQAFAAARAGEVATIIKNFGAGTGLSDADREFAVQAAGGKITLTEPAIRRILDINARASRNIIRAHNAEANRLGSEVPFDMRVPEPPERVAPPAGWSIKRLP